MCRLPGPRGPVTFAKAVARHAAESVPVFRVAERSVTARSMVASSLLKRPTSSGRGAVPPRLDVPPGPLASGGRPAGPGEGP